MGMQQSWISRNRSFGSTRNVSTHHAKMWLAKIMDLIEHPSFYSRKKCLLRTYGLTNSQDFTFFLQQLNSLLTASLSLRNSKKIRKILEVRLWMITTINKPKFVIYSVLIYQHQRPNLVSVLDQEFPKWEAEFVVHDSTLFQHLLSTALVFIKPGCPNVEVKD